MSLKWFAKKIIISAPFSVEYSSEYVPSIIKSTAKRVDFLLQNWALTQSDSFSGEEWRKIQLIKLKKLLIHAREGVPSWDDLFKKIGFIPEKFERFEDLRHIPVITRADIKKIPIEALTAKNIPRWRFKEAVTSGSTGEPLKFFQDLRDNLRREVNTFHELRYAGVSYRDNIVVLDLDKHNDLNNFGKRFSSIEWGDSKFRQSVIYPYLKLKPAVLIANGSNLRRFLFLIRQEAPDTIFKTLMYRGEHISKSERNNISRFFKCPIFTCYGSRETSLLGIECEYHKLHLAPWMSYFEVVSDSEQTVPEGDEGNVVVTFFENFVMPFMRYKIGDRAIINTESCSCGRKSKTINFFGRESEFIKFPDSNKSLSILSLTRRVDENYCNSIGQYQFELIGERLIVFRYVPVSAVNETEKNNLSGLLEKALGHQFRIVLEEVAAINPLADGKTPILIRNKPRNL
ncbi:MAG: hypothetical protein Q7R91_02245 [bacterium]|nr:hypothetical protein [bacterium]